MGTALPLASGQFIWHKLPIPKAHVEYHINEIYCPAPLGRYQKAVHLKISTQHLNPTSCSKFAPEKRDADGMHARAGSKKEVRFALNPLLSGYDKVTPRLLEMKAISQEGLWMVSTFWRFLNKKWIHTTQIEVPEITTFRLGVPKYNSIVVTIFIAFLPAFTWCIFLAPINSTSRFFLPANIVGSYLGLCAVERVGMGFIVLCHLLESLYTFSSCQKHCMVFFVGVRRGVSYFFFRLVQRLTYPICAIYHCAGPVGGLPNGELQCRYISKSRFHSGPLLFFFFLNELRDCLRVIALRLTGLWNDSEVVWLVSGSSHYRHDSCRIMVRALRQNRI